MKTTTLITRLINAAILAFLALFFCFGPVVNVLRDLRDPAIRSGAIPRSAWRLHRDLSPNMERWAVERVRSMRGIELSTSDISGTEWPLFGSVFYLWATESLQDAWEKDPSISPVAPKVYAKSAIEALGRLVVDPKQAGWVQKHWGANYLKTENVFYRMLLISGLTSHARLTGDSSHLPLLRDQVESLSAELDASPHGLLDDYPGQCYPCDVLTAIASIRRADAVLGTDHSAFAARSLRAFQSKEKDRGLPPYLADPREGKPITMTRGCANSCVVIGAPELWPDQARLWYELYTRQFWQEVWTGAGFREFQVRSPMSDWHFDVDSGPVIKGYGFAACAFGVGAAKANGHMEHAYPLTSEMASASWPLPGGLLLIPRFLSNATDAPYLGEAGILYSLTRRPVDGVSLTLGGSVPGFTWVIMGIQIVLGLGLLAGVGTSVRKWWPHRSSLRVPSPGTQFVVWLALLTGAAVLLVMGKHAYAMVLVLGAQLLPRGTHSAADSADSIS